MLVRLLSLQNWPYRRHIYTHTHIHTKQTFRLAIGSFRFGNKKREIYFNYQNVIPSYTTHNIRSNNIIPLPHTLREREREIKIGMGFPILSLFFKRHENEQRRKEQKHFVYFKRKRANEWKMAIDRTRNLSSNSFGQSIKLSLIYINKTFKLIQKFIDDENAIIGFDDYGTNIY